MSAAWVLPVDVVSDSVIYSQCFNEYNVLGLPVGYVPGVEFLGQIICTFGIVADYLLYSFTSSFNNV